MNNENKGLFLKRTEIFKCFMAYLADLSVALLPMMIWNVTMLAVFGSLLPMSGLDAVTNLTMTLITITAILGSNVMLLITRGKTLGMMIFHLRVAHKNGGKAQIFPILLREVVYFTIPFLYFFYEMNVMFLLGYAFINFVCMMIDKKRRLPIDFICQTCLISDKDEVATVKKKEEVKPVQEVNQIKTIETKEFDKIDLHIHSNFSFGGKLTVEDIFKQAKEKGLETISITDLNSIKACSMAEKMSELYQINYVHGIEIEAQLYGKAVNVLGYGIDSTNELFATVENENIMNEQNASRRRCALFEKRIEKSIPLEKLLENNKFQRVSGAMLAIYVLTNSEYDDCVALSPYRNGSIEDNVKLIVNDFFVMGKTCYVEKNRPTLQDVLQVIDLANGSAVIANPYGLLSKEPAVFNQIVSNPLVKGIEVFRSDYTNEMMSKIIKVAKEKELLLTCGSDFYGTTNKEIGKCNLPANAKTIVEVAIKQMIKKPSESN